MPLEEAVRQALTQVHGAFGLGVICADEPDILVGARRGSPLILGIGEDECAALLERCVADGSVSVAEIAGDDDFRLLREREWMARLLAPAGAVMALD